MKSFTALLLFHPFVLNEVIITSDIRNLATDSRKGAYPYIYGHFSASIMDMKNVFHLAISDKFDANKFITKIMPLSQINEALAIAKRGDAIKIVLEP